jgi:hypothetical protein
VARKRKVFITHAAQEAAMEAHASKQPTNPVLIIAAIGLILFCTAGIGALMGWIATSIASGDPPLTADAPAKAATPTPARAPVPEKHQPQSHIDEYAHGTQHSGVEHVEPA